MKIRGPAIMRAWMNVLRTSVFIAAILLAPRVTNAQTVDAETLARAQSLVDKATSLMELTQFAEACPKLEEATQLVPRGIGVKLALAECYFGAGRLASAWRQYVHAEILATAAGDDRANEAREEAKKLKPKLATITIAVPNSIRSIEGLSITLDGLELSPDDWGTPVPVDMGRHYIEAKAPGRRSWKQEVKITANGRPYVETVPMLEMDSNTIERIRKGVMVTGTGLAVVGIGAGIGFTIATHAQHTEALTAMNALTYRRSVNEMVCPPGRLDPACDELRNMLHKRDTYRSLATAGFIVGGVAAAGTFTLWLISGKNAEAKKKHESLLVVPSLSGILVMGTF